MGEFADMILDGLFCQFCGVAMDDDLEEAPGIPVACAVCAEEE